MTNQAVEAYTRALEFDPGRAEVERRLNELQRHPGKER
jgi:hypothetical protein